MDMDTPALGKGPALTGWPLGIMGDREDVPDHRGPRGSRRRAGDSPLRSRSSRQEKIRLSLSFSSWPSGLALLSTGSVADT